MKQPQQEKRIYVTCGSFTTFICLYNITSASKLAENYLKQTLFHRMLSTMHFNLNTRPSVPLHNWLNIDG